MYNIIAPLMPVERRCKRYALLLIRADSDGLPYESTVQQLSLIQEDVIEEHYQKANITRICSLLMVAIDKYRTAKLAPGFLDLIECMRDIDSEIVEKYFLDEELNVIEDLYRELILSPDTKFDIDNWDLSDFNPAFKATLRHLFKNNLEGNRAPAADLAGSSSGTGPVGEQSEQELNEDQRKELRSRQREEERESLRLLRQEERHKHRERDRLRKRRCRILQPHEARSNDCRARKRKREKRIKSQQEVHRENYHRIRRQQQLERLYHVLDDTDQEQQQPANRMEEQSSEIATAPESSPLVIISDSRPSLGSLQPIIYAADKTDEVEIHPSESDLPPFNFDFQHQQQQPQSWPLQQPSPDPFAIFESPELLAEDQAQPARQMQSLQSFVDPMAPDSLHQTDDQASSFDPYTSPRQHDTNLGREAIVGGLLRDDCSQIGDISVTRTGQSDGRNNLSTNEAGHDGGHSSVPPMADRPAAIEIPALIGAKDDLSDPWQDFDRLFSRDGQ